MIAMKSINKGYMLGEERLPILKDISFSVDKGEYVAILGPSGSGKTTFMNIVGCMDVMDSGEYYLDGMAIHETREDDLTEVRNLKIGFVFKNYQLIPTYNVMIQLNCWAWSIESGINQVNYQADKSSGFPLPERWWEIRRSCWRMNPQARWTRPAVKMY